MRLPFIFAGYIFLELICPFGVVNGQSQYYSRILTTENGIPHNHVRGITQDRQGFLWISTWDGVSRFDGYEFKNYYHNPGDSTSLAYFHSDYIVVDSLNNVWVHSIPGISKYNRAADNFLQIKDGPYNLIGLDKTGKLWCAVNTEIQRWNYTLNRFESVQVDYSGINTNLIEAQSVGFVFDNNNTLWVILMQPGHYFLARCDQSSPGSYTAQPVGSVKMTNIQSNHGFIVDMKIYKKGQEIWFLGTLGTYRFDSGKQTFFPFSGDLSTNELDIFTADEKRQILNTVKNYMPYLEEENRSTGNGGSMLTETFYTDHQQTVWQSVYDTYTGSLGLVKNVAVPSYFTHHFFEMNPENRQHAIFPVTVDKYGTLWAGPARINQFFIKDKGGALTIIKQTDEETWKSGHQPRAFLADSTGIWIGYARNVLLFHDYKTQQTIRKWVMQNTSEIQSVSQSFTHLIKEGDIVYVFGYEGIYKFHIHTGKLETIVEFGRQTGKAIHSVCRDTNSGWWVGLTKSMIIRYDDNFNEIHTTVLGSGLFNIEDIIEGDDHDLWISQLGGGLVHYQKETGDYRIYTVADGLSNNTCYGLLKDKKGNIWVSTNHGISCFNVQTSTFRKFGPEEGLMIDEFNSDNSFLAPDGRMYFAGMGGVVSFYPDSIYEGKVSNHNPRLLITRFKISGEDRYFNEAIYDCDSVILSPGDNNFQVEFARLDFVHADKIRYRYRLLGENNTFTVTGFRHRTVNYANLNPGDYALEIESADPSGEWIPGTILHIRIPSLFYQTFWFRALLICIPLLITGTVLYFYIQQLKLRAIQHQNILKLECLRSQMNPHFIFNSLNSVNYFISQNDRLSANRYIADFARLIRSFLGNLAHDYILLSKELETLHDYLRMEHLRFGDKFDYEVYVSENIQADDLYVFPGLVQPFAENAIWHGIRGLRDRKGFLQVTFEQDKDKHLVCTITDDGIGRKNAEEQKSILPGKTSRGIALVTERLKIVNAIRKQNYTIRIDNLFPEKEESGTRVILEIPVKRTSDTS